MSLWLYLKKYSYFSGLFGRSGRNYVIMLGNSDDPNFLIFITGLEKVQFESGCEIMICGWNEWHHVVCSNGGIGSIARTYINGRFVDAGFVMKNKLLII